MKGGWKWCLSDEMWSRIEPLIPQPKDHHPLGCHRRRVSNRSAMTAILFVLRTGCQWNALNATGICSSSSAHRRFMEWTKAGVFEAFWKAGLMAYDELKGIDWSWVSMDGTMTKAPLSGSKKNRFQSNGSRQTRGQAQRIDRGTGDSAGSGGGWGEPARHEAGARDVGKYRGEAARPHPGGTSRAMPGQSL